MPRKRSVRKGFEQRFLANLRAAGISGERLTVGFSGGTDSLALATALARVAPLLDCQVLLVHVDHQLRPQSSDQAIECQALADSLGLDFRSVAIEPGLIERTKAIGLEEAARRERYLALAAVAADWGSSTLLLGHQCNDQAESVLLHLFRGAGLNGLAGMALQEERAIPWWTGELEQSRRFQLVRPLLSETRATIEDYVAEGNRRPVVDPSNASTDFDRNWIRLQILPAILDRWPAAITSMTRLASLASGDLDLLELIARQRAAEMISVDRTLRSDALMELPAPIANRVLIEWLVMLGVTDIDSSVVERCNNLARTGDETTVVEAAGDISVVIAGGELMTFEHLIESSANQFPLHGATRGPVWTVAIGPGAGQPDATFDTPRDAELEVRALRAGDRWLGTRRAVAEDLRANGIHPLVRFRVLAVTCAEGVLLIPAIYPTIRSANAGGEVTKVEMRWRKLD